MRRTQAEGVLAQEGAVDSAILLGALQVGPSVGAVQADIPSMMDFAAAQALENAPAEDAEAEGDRNDDRPKTLDDGYHSPPDSAAFLPRR